MYSYIIGLRVSDTIILEEIFLNAHRNFRPHRSQRAFNLSEPYPLIGYTKPTLAYNLCKSIFPLLK